MAITYYALPVPPKLVDIAKINPGAFLSDAYFWRSWSSSSGRPAALYLEKTWRDLQWLLSNGHPDPPRAAYELVRGDVLFCGGGYESYQRVLDPDQVAAAALDLGCVNVEELYREGLPLLSPDWASILYQRRDGITAYLADATAFTVRLARRGLGLIYCIG